MVQNKIRHSLFDAVLQIVKDRKILYILFISFMAGIMGFFYASMQKPVFESHLTFALDEGGSSDNTGIAGIAAQFGFNIGGGNNDVFGGENITEIMRSRRMIERVLLSSYTINNTPITLADQYTKINKKKWKNQAGVINVNFPVGIKKESLNYLQDSILFCMYKEIEKLYLESGRPDRRLNVFEVKFTSPDEKFTKVFTDRIVSETSTFYTELRTKKSKQTLEVLESRVGAMKGALNTSISKRADVQDANLNPAFAEAQVPMQKQQFNMQVYGGAYGELYKSMELARYQLLKDVPLLQIIDAADYPMKRIKPSRLKTAITFSAIAFLLMLILLYSNHVYAKKQEFLNNINKPEL